MDIFAEMADYEGLEEAERISMPCESLKYRDIHFHIPIDLRGGIKIHRLVPLSINLNNLPILRQITIIADHDSDPIPLT
jgi:hypothetical protein